MEDLGVTDANNMGAAMARSAFDTIYTYFSLSEDSSACFDYIVTGDLGKTGSYILEELIDREELHLHKKKIKQIKINFRSPKKLK